MILIGFMGSGKTTLAKEIKKRTGKIYVDLDEYIVEKYQMSIPYIFNQYGEMKFREFEYCALKNVIDKGYIIATGGGVVTYSKSFQLLQNTSTKIVFLDAPFEILFNRIKKDSNRPNAKKSYDDIHNLYLERKHLYKSVADVIVNTEQTLDEVFHNVY